MTVDDCFRVLPFRFLDAADRAWLRPRLTLHEHPEGHAVFARGDRGDRRCFLLLDGRVDLFDEGRSRGAIAAGHYFGERAAIFDQPRTLDVVAGTPITVAVLAGDDLLELLRRSPVFAEQMGWRLRDKQGLLLAFERFRAELLLGARRGYIVLPKLIPLYRPLRPALHPHADDPTLDVDALGYAVHRLPANLTRTLSWFLTDDLPYLYSRPVEVFTRIPTSARRRAVWEIMPGKNMVLLRDGMSDLVDLVTCLCIYAVEARKIRRRLRDPALLLALAQSDLPALPFDARETAALRTLWPDLPARLLDIATSHEDHAIAVHKSLDNYNSAHAERWTHQIADAVRDLVGAEPHELPAEFYVHIVSSNTHSVGNCLSRWLPANAARIVAWGEAHRPDLARIPWADPRDRVIALARHLLATDAEAAAERARSDDDAAVVHVRESAFTGIDIQLFDLGRLAARADALEGWLDGPAPSGRPGLLVNIDYAFGQQAEAIVASLIALFGARIRSVDVLGKAGGLVGNRGDVLVATSFVEQEDDQLHVPTVHLDAGRLAARVPDRGVHVGPVLTVLGTVLQNPTMLNFYKHVWGAVGLEMEGSYYARQILESQRRGALRPDLDLRFVYYVSDLPLRHDATLAGPLAPIEGIPPLYAITREVLTTIFERRR